MQSGIYGPCISSSKSDKKTIIQVHCSLTLQQNTQRLKTKPLTNKCQEGMDQQNTDGWKITLNWCPVTQNTEEKEETYSWKI